MKYFISIILMLVAGIAFAQTEEVLEHIRAGNDFYRKEKYDPAANEYSKALQLDPANTTAKFNLANTMYKLNRQQDATKAYRELIEKTSDKGLKSNTYYNHGVIETRQKKLEESIESYKSALRQNPDNKEARENLQKALLELKKKNQNNQQNKKQQQQQQNKSQSKMSPKEAEQRLKLLEQKEKEVQERINKEKSKSGGGTGKDW
jgi:Ca-activated chloride channel homolog